MADSNLPTILALVEQLRPALERNARAAVIDIVRQLVALRAPMGEQWEQLALIATGYGEPRLAVQAMDMLVDASGGAPAARFRKAGLLSMLHRPHEVEALLRTLPPTVPDPFANAHLRGATALSLGDRNAAQHLLDRAVRMRPRSGFAWFSLSMAVDLATNTAIAERIIAAEPGMAQAPAPERAAYFYALGKTHAERGDPTRAFDSFARGAALTRSIIAYDPQADAADAARATEGYTADRIAAIAARQTAPTERTIFVMGLPRSGTTLVEQILTSHSSVSAGGETGRLMLLADEVGGQDYPSLAAYVETAGVEDAASLWDHWIEQLYPDSDRIVDKTVNSSRFLGLAAALLPDAPLIWVTRAPLDRAWSCFRTSFSGSAIPWSYDLREIAAHFRIEDELMAHWQRILGDRLLVVPYEALVTEPKPWIRLILAHCRLPEESQVFAPHENRRAVQTASVTQVRRPIHRDSIGAADPYRAFLEPFVEAYFAGR